MALLARKPENYESLVREINNAGGKAIGVSTDASSAQSVKAAFDAINKARGTEPLAAAIFNVGGSFIRKPFLELSPEEFESGWEANGYVYPTKGSCNSFSFSWLRASQSIALTSILAVAVSCSLKPFYPFFLMLSTRLNIPRL